MASWYSAGIKAVMDGSVSLLNNDIKVALVKDTYTPAVSHSSFATSVAGHETSGAGYSAKSLSGKTVALDSNGRAVFDADDAVWSALTANFRYVVIYSGNVLIGWLDLGEQSVVNKDMTMKWETATKHPMFNEWIVTATGLLRGAGG